MPGERGAAGIAGPKGDRVSDGDIGVTGCQQCHQGSAGLTLALSRPAGRRRREGTRGCPRKGRSSREWDGDRAEGAVKDTRGGQPEMVMVASKGRPLWPSRGAHGGHAGPLPVASLSHLSPQGLTGPIGPPGPAGPNGEKVRPGWPRRCCHGDRPHPIPGADPTRSLGQIPPDPRDRPIHPP